MTTTPTVKEQQQLYLVFGGELVSLDAVAFRDPHTLDIVGVYPDLDNARAAWKARAHATVDNAHMRYFVVHLHKLLESADA
jgi:hypothetical protein